MAKKNQGNKGKGKGSDLGFRQITSKAQKEVVRQKMLKQGVFHSPNNRDAGDYQN